MRAPQRPQRLWIVRHGESAGNVALRTAEAEGLHTIAVGGRDADVPLSPLGERQAAALGAWFAEQPPDERPTVIISSPYVRARETARILSAQAGLGGIPFHLDERLREKEFGALNRLTKAGIAATLPEQAELRQTLGKFYYRPPGGESWCDIVLRLRSFWNDLTAGYADARVLLTTHSVVTFCLRYVIEGLTEEQVLALDAAHDIANCAVTGYRRSDTPQTPHPTAGHAVDVAGMVLDAFNFAAPVAEAGEKVTAQPDAPLPK